MSPFGPLSLCPNPNFGMSIWNPPLPFGFSTLTSTSGRPPSTFPSIFPEGRDASAPMSISPFGPFPLKPIDGSPKCSPPLPFGFLTSTSTSGSSPSTFPSKPPEGRDASPSTSNSPFGPFPANPNLGSPILNPPLPFGLSTLTSTSGRSPSTFPSIFPYGSDASAPTSISPFGPFPFIPNDGSPKCIPPLPFGFFTSTSTSGSSPSTFPSKPPEGRDASPSTSSSPLGPFPFKPNDGSPKCIPPLPFGFFRSTSTSGSSPWIFPSIPPEGWDTSPSISSSPFGPFPLKPILGNPILNPPLPFGLSTLTSTSGSSPSTFPPMLPDGRPTSPPASRSPFGPFPFIPNDGSPKCIPPLPFGFFTSTSTSGSSPSTFPSKPPEGRDASPSTSSSPFGPFPLKPNDGSPKCIPPLAFGFFRSTSTSGSSPSTFPSIPPEGRDASPSTSSSPFGPFPLKPNDGSPKCIPPLPFGFFRSTSTSGRSPSTFPSKPPEGRDASPSTSSSPLGPFPLRPNDGSPKCIPPLAFGFFRSTSTSGSSPSTFPSKPPD